LAGVGGGDQKAEAGNSFRLFIFRFECGGGPAPLVLRKVLPATRYFFCEHDPQVILG
jgi:hypothetical protein